MDSSCLSAFNFVVLAANKMFLFFAINFVYTSATKALFFALDFVAIALMMFSVFLHLI